MSLLDYIVKGAETGLSLLANTRDASNASLAGEYNAQVAEENARRQEMDADFIRRRTEFQIDAIRRNAGQLEGTQRAGYGASGVSVASGSAVDVLKDTAAQAALDVEIIHMQGEAQVAMAKQAASDLRGQADVERWKGDRTSKGFELAAGASLLKGGADMYTMWRKRNP
jgi:hypothetical protein